MRVELCRGGESMLILAGPRVQGLFVGWVPWAVCVKELSHANCAEGKKSILSLAVSGFTFGKRDFSCGIPGKIFKKMGGKKWAIYQVGKRCGLQRIGTGDAEQGRVNNRLKTIFKKRRR